MATTDEVDSEAMVVLQEQNQAGLSISVILKHARKLEGLARASLPNAVEKEFREDTAVWLLNGSAPRLMLGC